MQKYAFVLLFALVAIVAAEEDYQLTVNNGTKVLTFQCSQSSPSAVYTKPILNLSGKSESGAVTVQLNGHPNSLLRARMCCGVGGKWADKFCLQNWL